MVGVLQETGKHFHHAGIQPFLLSGEAVPVRHIGVVAGEHGAFRDDAQLLLAREGVLAVGVPAAIEFALVFVGPFLRHVVGRMHGAGAEVHEEGFVGRHLLGVGDHRPGLRHQIGGEVVALLRRGRRFHLAVVLHQLRVVLVRVAAEEAVEALEAPAQGPAVVGAGC